MHADIVVWPCVCTYMFAHIYLTVNAFHVHIKYVHAHAHGPREYPHTRDRWSPSLNPINCATTTMSALSTLFTSVAMATLVTCHTGCVLEKWLALSLVLHVATHRQPAAPTVI